MGLIRRGAAGAMMAAAITAVALGTAAASHADTGAADTSSAGNPAYTHPAFPNYKNGLPGYSPSPTSTTAARTRANDGRVESCGLLGCAAVRRWISLSPGRVPCVAGLRTEARRSRPRNYCMI